MRRSICLVPALLASLALPAHASWYLDNESSRLSFVTTKNIETAEVHRFLILHGKVDAKGVVQLQVDMDSVSSGIPKRDEQMRRDLFEVARYPQATVSAKLDLGPINDLANGAQLEMRLPLRVALHGHEHGYNAQLLATRLDERRFQVVTLEPLVVRAEDFGLIPGIATLRQSAGLTSISLSVPVGAVLIFTAR